MGYIGRADITVTSIQVARSEFVASGGEPSSPLPINTTLEEHVDLFFNGIHQEDGAYTLSGGNVIYATPLVAGTLVTIVVTI